MLLRRRARKQPPAPVYPRPSSREYLHSGGFDEHAAIWKARGHIDVHGIFQAGGWAVKDPRQRVLVFDTLSEAEAYASAVWGHK